MRKQTYNDTMEALYETNKILQGKLENYQLSNEIKKEYGAKKRSRRGVHFTKVFLTKTRELSKLLNPSEKALLFDLQLHLDFDTSFVVDTHKQRLNVKGIAELSRMCERQVIRNIKTLEAKKVITKVKSGQNTHIILKPAFFFRGEGDGNDRIEDG